MAGPGRERIIHLARGAVGGLKDPRRIEQRGGRLLPQVAMARQLRKVNAEGGHQRGMVGGQKAGVAAQLRVGGGQALGVVVGRGRGRALGVFHQRPLQLVGNHAQLVPPHVNQRVHAGLDAHIVGRGDKLAIGDQAHLARARHDPLGIGGGDVVAQPDGARSQPGGVVELAKRVFGAQLGRPAQLPQLQRPLRPLGQQAPVVGRADRVHQVEVRDWARRQNPPRRAARR